MDWYFEWFVDFNMMSTRLQLFYDLHGFKYSYLILMILGIHVILSIL